MNTSSVLCSENVEVGKSEMSAKVSKTKGSTRKQKSGKPRSASFRLNSFFAGIGGFDTGFEQAGITPAYHCEMDEYCQSVLKKHWPDALCDDDVTKVDADKLPEAEVWSGGFPCQDVSVARGWLGRDGLRGARSGLFYAFRHLIEAKLPKVVVLENVTGLLSSHNGCDFHTVVRALTDLGYGVAWRVMNSRYFGSPQSRPRVFVCAWKGSVELAVNALYEKTPGHVAKDERKGFLTPSYDRSSGVRVPEVAYCLAATSGRHTGTDWSRSYVAYHDRVRRLTPVECEGLQGFPASWSVPGEDFTESPDDVDTRRYHALGNAVCVPVIEWIGRRIAAGLRSKKARSLKSLKGKTELEKLKALLPVVPGTDIKSVPLDDPQTAFVATETTYKWSTGGCAIGTSAITAPVPSGPAKPITSKFIDVVETGDVDDWYFLSPNAAEGILRRVRSQGRTLFKPLAEALERLADKKRPSPPAGNADAAERGLARVAINA
jgi:DNA (cytosine-5)-methyltransferase 1